jgi:hypothetical protein
MSVLDALKLDAPIEGDTFPVPRVGRYARLSGTRTIIAAFDMDALPEHLQEEVEEQEFEYAMAILGSNKTGIDSTIWFIPNPEGRHGARVKVAIEPKHAMRPDGVTASVPFDVTRRADGDIPPALERQVRAWIELNRDILTRYWRLEIDTAEFTAGLRKL